MTCQFCGSTLDDNEVECPFCGHRTGNAPVNNPERFEEDDVERGFAKFAPRKRSEEQRPSRQPAPERRERPVSSSLPKASGSSGMLSFILTAACALLLVINLFVSIGTKNKVADMYQDMLSQLYQIQNSEETVLSKLDSVDSTVSDVGSTLQEQEQSRNITITKQPTEASTYIGRGSAEDDVQNALLFSCEATGMNLSFVWQRYDDSSGSWIDIQFDPNNNETYGLHLYNTSTRSELSAHDLKAAGFGTYRCKVVDQTGYKTSDPVTITERPKD